MGFKYYMIDWFQSFPVYKMYWALSTDTRYIHIILIPQRLLLLTHCGALLSIIYYNKYYCNTAYTRILQSNITNQAFQTAPNVH